MTSDLVGEVLLSNSSLFLMRTSKSSLCICTICSFLNTAKILLVGHFQSYICLMFPISWHLRDVNANVTAEKVTKFG